MAKGPVQSGEKHPKPAKGTNGPNGTGGGTKTYTPPMPKPKRTGMK